MKYPKGKCYFCGTKMLSNAWFSKCNDKSCYDAHDYFICKMSGRRVDWLSFKIEATMFYFFSDGTMSFIAVSAISSVETIRDQPKFPGHVKITRENYLEQLTRLRKLQTFL